ncbi:hypothetical protein ATN38_23185 [Rhodococcus sp. FH8]|uniref:Ig-like domain-containing protein n=1 Tax=Rhodococcus TaxID=1827 RepID=UPI001C4E74DE|nr:MULTISPECIES: Ig-like domain-containing protein [Rhodococcus]MBW0287914.1 hypothetical protein [Rhodococcus sp. FH8]MCT6734089.1 Ig-like domain-containing protein [Rhodococcus qingshengii]
MNPRTLAVCAVVPALAAGLLAVSAPVAAASDTVTRTVSFEHKCRVDGATDWDSSFSDNMEVTAPTSVRPGEQFTVKLHPGTMRSSDSDTGRIKYDIALPQGATLVSYSLVGDSSSNLTGETAVLLRVGADGNANLAGEYLRITGTGNKTVNDGPSANDNKPKEGLQVKANTDFRLPAVELKLEARSDEGNATTHLRAGATSPSIKIKDTSMSFGESRWVNAAGYCVAAGEGRNALSTTEVFTTNQTETMVAVALEALTGEDVKIAASIDPNPGEGPVEFFDGDTKIGSATVDSNGHAELVWPFRDQGEHRITAKFLGTKKFSSSESADKTVTVTVPGVIVVEPVDPTEPETPGGTGSLGDIFSKLPTGSLGG